MTNAVKTRLIRIGNSQGIRIPKVMLEQVGFKSGAEDELFIEAQPGRIVITAAREPRRGWEAAAEAMAAAGDDVLLDGDELVETDWERTEWQW